MTDSGTTGDRGTIEDRSTTRDDEEIPGHLRVNVIQDAQDPRVLDFVALTDMDLRRRSEEADGIFIAESFFVLERVVQHGLRIRSVLVEPRRLPRVVDQLRSVNSQVDIYVAESDVLQRLVGYRVHRGVLASVQRPRAHTLQEVTSHMGHIVLLEGLVDPTNVGLAFRSAAAMGFAAVVISPDCADPLYRRSVRTSMGAVLHVPWVRSQSWSRTFEEIRGAGIEIMALTPNSSATDLDAVVADVARRGVRVGAAFGAEGQGLTEETLTTADHLARIAMGHGVDSLNVGATVAVVGYALRSVQPAF
jgi:tRNA G18 (ribose-2'-O)-methylase SpoU